MPVQGLTDRTMIETNGDYNKICDIMSRETSGGWMLSTYLMVKTNFASFQYGISLWDNGDVYIAEMERPTSLTIPIDDMRELQEWCYEKGWKRLLIYDKFLDDSASNEFWERLFSAGIIYNEELEKREKDRIKRIGMAEPESDYDWE